VGEVNKVGSDHVGLLVAGAFNASVSRDAVPADFAAVTTTTTAAKEKNEDEDEDENEDEDDDEASASVTAVECWRSTTDPSRELSPGRFAAFQTTAYARPALPGPKRLRLTMCVVCAVGACRVCGVGV
jgi:hypothetical protein